MNEEEVEKAMLCRIIVSALSLIAAQAHAQTDFEKYYTPGYNQCINESDGGDFSIRDCVVAETAIQDGRLNQAYKMVMERLPSARKAELRQAERVWILRRDATCKAQASDEKGGTLWHVVHSGCILDETIKRRLFLERYK